MPPLLSAAVDAVVHLEMTLEYSLAAGNAGTAFVFEFEAWRNIELLLVEWPVAAQLAAAHCTTAAAAAVLVLAGDMLVVKGALAVL